MEKEVKAYFERSEATVVWSAGGKLWRNASAAEGAGSDVKRWDRKDVLAKNKTKKED